MRKSKTNAFTLTELLVTVLILGILAAVAVPKFTRAVESRKTTEAEELMSAVRTEQEKRCTLDKNYITNLTGLKQILPLQNTQNFTYNLTSTGMEASSQSKYAYTLKMPSYRDGRICCENETECAKLNKNYPLCSALIARADYRSGSECAGEPPVIECSGSATQSCGCKNGGTQTRTCDTSAGTWSDWGACSIPAECECTETKPEESRECNGCGTQTRSVTCNTSDGLWNAGAWGACSKTEAECAPKCSDGETRISNDQTCLNGCGEVIELCQSGVWRGIDCRIKSGAECPTGYEQTTKCEDGINFSVKRCNAACRYEEIQSCPKLDCSNAGYKAAHKAECCPSAWSDDPVCYKLGSLHWSIMNSATNNDAIFRCNQLNTYDPGRKCVSQCSGKTSEGDSSCSSKSGPCFSKGELCIIQRTYCPVYAGSYTYGTPNCNCKGGEVLNTTYKECVQDYEKNGW